MRRRPPALLVALGVLLVLGGCGLVRVETPAPDAVVPGPAEAQRQQLAVQTAQLVDLASAASDDAADGAVATLLDAVAADAVVQLDALGGVWRSPGRTLSAPVLPGRQPEDVVTWLTDSATRMRDLAVSDDAGAQLLAGIAVARWLRADQLAAALGGRPAELQAPLPSALDPGSAAELVRTLDALGWTWEVVAARSDGDARQDAVTRAEGWRAEAAAVAAIAGLAGTDADPREVAYGLDVDDPDAVVAELLTRLVDGWLAQVASTTGADRTRVVDLALHAARTAGLAAPDATPPAVAGMG